MSYPYAATHRLVILARGQQIPVNNADVNVFDAWLDAFYAIAYRARSLKHFVLDATSFDGPIMATIGPLVLSLHSKLHSICIDIDVNAIPDLHGRLEEFVDGLITQKITLRKFSLNARLRPASYSATPFDYSALLKLPHLRYLQLANLRFPLTPSPPSLVPSQLRHLDIAHVDVRWLCGSLLPHCQTTLESLNLHVMDHPRVGGVFDSESPIQLPALQHLSIFMQCAYSGRTISQLLAFLSASRATTLELRLLLELWADEGNGVHALYRNEATSDREAVDQFFYSKVATFFGDATFLPRLQKLNYSVTGDDVDHIFVHDDDDGPLPVTAVLSTTTPQWTAFERVLSERGVRATSLLFED